MTDLKQLRQFVALAEALNYRVAAERLHMTQPPLSAAIRNLEAYLGCALFERNRRGTILTPAGQAALKVARQTLLTAEQFESTARDVASGSAGTLTIGYVASTAYHVLPTILPRFRASYPKTELKLVERTSESILELVGQRAVDIGFMRTPLIEPTHIAVSVFLKEPFLVALPDIPQWRDREFIELSELSHEPFVLYESPYAQSLAMMACEQAGFIPKISQKASGLPTVVSLVRCGLGIALVPAVAKQWPIEGVVFKPVHGIAKELEMGLAIARLSDPPSPLVDNFISILCQIFG